MSKHVYLMSTEEFDKFLKTKEGLSFINRFMKDNNFKSIKVAIDEARKDCYLENQIKNPDNIKTSEFERKSGCEIGYLEMNKVGVIIFVHCAYRMLKDALLFCNYIYNKKNGNISRLSCE